VQTTRERVLGVATTDRTQIMYFDTPGLISHAEGRRHGLARPLLTDAKNAVASADLVLGIVDGRYDTLPPIIAAIEAAVDVHGRRVPSVCVINKVDMLGRRDLARVLGDVAGVSRSAPEYQFDSVFQVSALRGDGVADLREYLQQQARPGMWQYAKGQATDQDLIKCVEERVREQLLRHLRLEVPYASFQRNLQIVETADEIEVVQAVVVKSKSQRNMVIGKGGVVIRAIAETAERELSEFCGKPVRLRLSVIVANEKQRRVRQM
jgi:GTP-binding protein Era